MLDSSIFLTKDQLGLVVVCFDIFSVLFLFAILTFLKTNQEQIAFEIDRAQVTGADFTAEIRNIPLPQVNTETTFKWQFWQWIED